jgi:hypothetical protein
VRHEVATPRDLPPHIGAPRLLGFPEGKDEIRVELLKRFWKGQSRDFNIYAPVACAAIAHASEIPPEALDRSFPICSVAVRKIRGLDSMNAISFSLSYAKKSRNGR